MIKKLLFTFCLIAAFSCSGKKDEKNSAEIAYTKAFKILKDKSYSEAADEFEKIDGEFPFSKWATKGQVMAIYARYKDEDYAKLIQASEDFLRLNPNSEYAAYVLYMKGLSYYNQMPSIERAQDSSQQSSYAFRELIARFPASDHSFDAREKLILVDEHLAGAKMSVGRYQMKNGNYVGAVNNFSEVIKRYRQTNQISEAYFRLGEVYLKIGLSKEGKNSMNLLIKKFPESEWSELAKKTMQNDESYQARR
jgi:outer membrane protein assembly factor BamD